MQILHKTFNDENNLHFVVVLQNFGNSFTESQYIFDFLAIPVSKKFFRKKIHDIELYLETIQEEVEEESLQASLHDKIQRTCSKINDIDSYLK